MEAYPLQWPNGYPRTHRPKSAAFKVSLADARDHLLDQIRQLGGASIVISSNAVLLRNGLPAAKQPRLEDKGVAVYFLFQGNQVVLPCDKWDEIAANIRAIGLTVDAMRSLERWGVGEMLKRAFEGFKALPEPTADWWKIIGVSSSASWDEIQKAYRTKAKVLHPDAGGNADSFQELVKAFDIAKQRCGINT